MNLTAVFDALAKLAQDVIIICAPLLIAVAAQWLRRQLQLAESKLRAGDLVHIQESARLIVRAAEQMGIDGQITDKKNWALENLQQYLTGRGVKVDVAAIDAAIEGAVIKEFGKPAVEDEAP